MFWKIALAAGILGLIVGSIVVVIALRVLTTTLDETAQDFSLAFFLFGIALTVGALLLALVSLVFVLRASKRDFDAKNK